MLLHSILTMHGAMCQVPVDWLRSTRSDIVDTIMIMRRGSIICNLVIMIRQTGDSLMPTVIKVPGRDLLGLICLRIAIIIPSQLLMNPVNLLLQSLLEP